MKKWILRAICGAVLLVLCLSVSAVVSATTIDQQKEASLTLEYKYNGEAFPDLEIRTYHVADVGDDYAFTLTEPFAQYPVELHDIKSQTEWNLIFQTLESYIWADGLGPTVTALTDGEGRVQFEKLRPGVYLTMPVAHLGEKTTTEFMGFMTVIPDIRRDGELNYDVVAYPKSTQYSPNDGDSRSLRVMKQWKDMGFEESRPDSVKVDIFRDGKFMTTIHLSAANNWSYGWTTENDGTQWTAVERDVPAQYKLTIEYKGDAIILTNVHKETVPPPTCGDATVLWPYILLMCFSGCVVILFALGRKRKAAG